MVMSSYKDLIIIVNTINVIITIPRHGEQFEHTALDLSDEVQHFIAQTVKKVIHRITNLLDNLRENNWKKRG